MEKVQKRKELSNKMIINFLKENYQQTNFLDGIKIKYRSLICPFIELIGYIPKDAKVADIGCGSGQFLLLASEFAEPSEVFGIEISKRLIDNANGLFYKYAKKEYEFQVYDGIIFPEKLKEMDVIFLIDVLHHVPKNMQTVFLENLINSLKPTAMLVIKDIDASSPLVIFNKLHDFIFACEVGNEIKLSSVKNQLENNKLTIIQSFTKRMYLYPHFAFVAQKVEV